MTRAYDALVLDIDGTLLDEREQIAERTRTAIARARAEGVVVMLATGRSHDGTRDIAHLLELEAPSVVFNGAAVYCRHEDRLIERYALPEALVSDLLTFAKRSDLLPVVACPDGQYAREPHASEAAMLAGFRILHHLPHGALPRNEAMRVTLFSNHHRDSEQLYAEVLEAAMNRPAYFTHFGLAALAGFRDSDVQVVDVQAECAGKAEALRVLASRYGVPAARVVAVGDANNDLPILEAAGLGVAMGNGTPEAKRAAGRVIGHNDSEALAELIETLFLEVR